MVEPDRPQMTIHVIWRMKFACWITKSTYMHSEYVMHTFAVLLCDVLSMTQTGQNCIHEEARVH